MDAAVLKEIEQLRSLPVSGLREKYREVFVEDSRSNHKDYLYRRIAWRHRPTPKGICPSVRGAARLKLRTTPTCASGHRRLCREPMHRSARPLPRSTALGTAGYRRLERSLPGSSKARSTW